MGEHGKHRSLVIRSLIVLGLAALASPVQAQTCRLALALAIDISSSVDAAEDALQRQGLAAALVAPEVQSAFFGAPLPVAISVYEWSGSLNQVLLLDWRLIESPADLQLAARQVGTSQRSTNESSTAMGHALAYGATLLQRAPRCLVQTIDISGDGKNNDGYEPAIAYSQFPFEAVTVNGLVINAADFEGEIDLIPYYRDNVLRGPGAFMEIADGFEDFERAMRRKLERELRSLTVSELGTPAQ